MRTKRKKHGCETRTYGGECVKEDGRTTGKVRRMGRGVLGLRTDRESRAYGSCVSNRDARDVLYVCMYAATKKTETEREKNPRRNIESL